jgi:hypothetical protein
MLETMRQDDEDAITNDPLRMRYAIIIKDIDLDEGYLRRCSSVRMKQNYSRS